MSRITRTLLAVALVALVAPGAAAAAPTLVPVGSFDQPVYAGAAPRDTSRLFVVERPGRVGVVRDGATLPDPFLDVSADVATDGERGMLSIAFPPDYATTGLLYVYMVAKSPVGELQVREFHRSDANADLADPGPGRIVWHQAHNEGGKSNHNGGQIEFGPDGLLWLAPGDGGGSDDQFGHAQDLGSQLGKVLRIDPRPGDGGGYTTPPDNPYGSTVWARGLRNPFRFSFDRGSGDLLIGDVGQGAREEIDWARRADGLGRGANFGWSCREGAIAGPHPERCPAGTALLEPIFDYSQVSPRAVTGGYVVRDPGLPSLVGRYVYADTYAGDVRSLAPGDARASESSAGLAHRDLLVSFGEDACGHLYVVSLNGTVDRVQDGAVGACVLKPDPDPAPTPAPAGTESAAPPADGTAPALVLTASRRQRFGRLLTVRLSALCSEACSLRVGARVAGGSLRSNSRALAAGRSTALRLRPSRAGARRIGRSLRRHRSLLVRLSARATDAAGNARSVTRRVRVRR